MKIGTPKEVFEGEARVAMTPDSALQLQKLGHECYVETGAGSLAGFSDAAYEEAGVTVIKTAAALWKASDVVAKVRVPTETELKRLTADKTLISFFNPAGNEEGMELAKSKGATVIAMEMVPRISRAQKMDALSSMANIAGYRAVIEAGNNFGRFFTGQVTAAGKVPPAKVLIVGAGVAGLAAIGTATSLGAITYAFDVRPEVAEQVESMGAEFVYLDFEEEQADGSSSGGYASVSSPEFREAQLAKFRELAPEMDIVITTALIPNREAPELWTPDMVAAMKRGSVIIDLAAEIISALVRTLREPLGTGRVRWRRTTSNRHAGKHRAQVGSIVVSRATAIGNVNMARQRKPVSSQCLGSHGTELGKISGRRLPAAGHHHVTSLAMVAVLGVDAAYQGQVMHLLCCLGQQFTDLHARH